MENKKEPLMSAEDLLIKYHNNSENDWLFQNREVVSKLMKEYAKYVLPTDKPSRLIIYSTLLNEFRLLNEPIEDWKHKRNIYITNDEKPKSGDYVYNTKLKCVRKYFLQSGEITSLQKEDEKIILTTDKDLIKDGVQAIDDEFIEWFVKNPSCEFAHLGFTSIIGDLETKRTYKIIIPKEEPKQDLEKEMFELEQELDIPSHLRWHNSKPKQETLEEVAFRKRKELGLKGTIEGFIAGFKACEEQNKNMYSEEEVLQILSKFRELRLIDFQEWFEQFKNK